MTVYYRWHPLFGRSLRVRKRVNNRNGELIFCELPDNTVCGLPTWMFSTACTRFTVGPPLFSIEALRELREVLTAWQSASSWDKASLKPSLPEVLSEATKEVDRVSTAASAAAYRVQGGDSRRQTERTRSSAHRTTGQRHTRKAGASNKGRQR